MIPGLDQGRMVRFVPQKGKDNIKTDRHISAVICRVHDVDQGIVNLRLFLDGPNDCDLMGSRTYHHAEWITAVPYDQEGKKPFSWHFPPNAPSSGRKVQLSGG